MLQLLPLRFCLPLALLLAPLAARAQVGIGTTTPNAAAALDITATGKGLLIPRLDSASRTAIASPPAGLLVYQTSPRAGFYYYAGSAWVFLPDKARAGDNLGNGVATTSVNLNGNRLVGGTAASPSPDGVQVSATGQVGIGLGAATPTERLQVDGGNLKVGAAQWANAADDRLLKFGDGSYVALGETGADDVLQFQAKDFRLNPSPNSGYTGKVGIGLGAGTAASEQLEVGGNVKITGTAGTTGLVFPDGTKQFTAVSGGGGLTLPYSGSANPAGSGPVFSISNTGSGQGLRGTSVSGQGVVGRVNGTGAGQGVVGVKGTTVPAIANAGVVGLADADPAVYAASNSNSAVVAITAATGTGQAAVQGTATATGASTLAAGVSGNSSANANTTGGVVGSNYGGVQAVGVLGQTSNGYGVRGTATAGGYGVSGQATDSYGVIGGSSSGVGTYGGSSSGSGVYGTSSTSYGVQGVTGAGNTGAAAGVYGSSTSGGVGVLGTTTNSYAVRGEATGGGFGVIGLANSGMGGIGVYGVAASGTNADAVYGVASGTGRAAYFNQNSSAGTANALEVQNGSKGRTAYFNQSNSASTANALEVRSTGTGTTAYFNQGNTSSTAKALEVIGAGNSVAQVTNTGTGYGLLLSGNYLSGPNNIYSIGGSLGMGYPLSSDAAKIFVRDWGGGYKTLDFLQTSDPNFNSAGISIGSDHVVEIFENALVSANLEVAGTLSKGGGSFKIDHPLDPENQYLYHSFVESPDMLNIYNGNVTLDTRGEATVELPDYFEALNRDFRYQLTPIGAAFTPYVLAEVSNNQFRIAGQPGAKVSWQVTGIRQDKWANQNRIPNAAPKEPKNRGKYLHPAAYGLPAARGIGYRPAAARPVRQAAAQ